MAAEQSKVSLHARNHEGGDDKHSLPLMTATSTKRSWTPILILVIFVLIVVVAYQAASGPDIEAIKTKLVNEHTAAAKKWKQEKVTLEASLEKRVTEAISKSTPQKLADLVKKSTLNAALDILF